MEKDERSETEPETNSDDNEVSFRPSNVAAIGNNNVKLRHRLQQSQPSADENN